MNFAVVLGQLCVDRGFRDRFFADGGRDAEAALGALSLPLTWAEKEWLLHISTKGGSSPGLRADFQAINDALTNAGCPRPPCPVPTYFTLTKPAEPG